MDVSINTGDLKVHHDLHQVINSEILLKNSFCFERFGRDYELF